jgi:GDP-4-dehydro-6-deoxy-D-mannose reductase
MSTTCLVFGARGFIGRQVMSAGPLFERQLGVSRLVAAPGEVDIRRADEVRGLVRMHRPHVVLHLAAVSYVPDTVRDPATTYQINFIGTVNLLAALTEARFTGRMLFTSSAEVYGAVGEAELPLREDRLFAPRTPYAVSKIAGEMVCLQHALTGDLDVRIVRPFNVIGEGQSSKFAVSSFARQIAELEYAGGGEISVGNLDVTRDFVDARDAVAAFVAILRAGRRGEAYNVCSGREVLLSDLLARLVALANASVQIVVDSARVRPAEQRRVCGSYEKLAAETGWQPVISLDESLRWTLEGWRRATHLATAPPPSSV